MTFSQCACAELSTFVSEGSAEVYEQPCACQLRFFLKPVQKCMNNFVHVHQQTCVAQNNFPAEMSQARKK